MNKNRTYEEAISLLKKENEKLEMRYWQMYGLFRKSVALNDEYQRMK
jgi:hypothetical protein